MAVFEGCSVVLDLKKLPYKEKKRLMSAIIDYGGNISYVVNQKCSFVVTSSLEDLSSNRLRSAQKHQIPVVGLQFVWSCLEKGLLLPAEEHGLKPEPSDVTHPPPPHPGMKLSTLFPAELKSSNQISTRLCKENDLDVPEFPLHFQVAKYTIFHKAASKVWSVLELQSARGEKGQQYRIVKSVLHETVKTAEKDKQLQSSSSEEAVEVYLIWREELIGKGFTQKQTLPPVAEKLASRGLQQLLLEEKLNCSTVTQEVGTFVELIWTEALGSLNSILTVPVSSISLNDVSRVEGLLLQAQKREGEDEVKALLDEVKTLLPLVMVDPDSKQKLISQKLDLCQLIRDILNMSEATLGNPSPSSLGKYRALRCSIDQVPPQSPEFQSVSQLLQDRPVKIQQILRVSRGAEVHMFKEEIGNIKPLLHSSRPSSFMGILSRGLLLPRVGVEQHGIERTDVGNLGSGIYFSDSLCTSIKYSKPSEMDGSRLLLVCDVALGQCKDLHWRDITLTRAPEGYSSVHGVQQTQNTHTDFEDDEYVVYNTDQVRIKYVVRYTLEEDQMKSFQPHVDTSVELVNSTVSAELLSIDDTESLEMTKNPLEEVTAGLLDSSGQTLPLQAVHVRCKLMDLLSQVIIFQTYTNNSTVPIEAKYVFPLEETAAVCGFEAFINGKHVIGKVKEKEQARKEYRQAIEKGHGAYLMDQDAPDVFTISVGNLPPGATVLIKVTFVTELVVRAGSILFSLPGSVAPWQQSAALNQRTQMSVEKVCVNELQPSGEFSLSMSIEMPYEIKDLECSHRIQIKRTDCKAVVSTKPEQTLNTDGFQLSFTLSQIHMPRMWVEKHPDKDSEACMLVFYPDFESTGVSSVSDVVILLDTSESMRGEATLNARRLAIKVLNSLDRSLRVNIISFGTDYKEAFPSASVLDNKDVFKSAKTFIMSSPAVGGSTELWRPLRSLNLLPPSHGVRNVLLVSDGHVQNQPQTLQMVRENARHTRLFTCGLSPTANRHMLRALAQAGGGAFEFFDTKKKHTWSEKVNSQVKCMASPGCSSVAVKWQQFSPTAPSPVQAPSQLHALFSDCHTLVYGFVPHCTQATLFGDLSGQEIKTMVSTTELQKTRGTFLHKLTARAIIRDYEDGSLGSSEAEHEGKKAELKSYIIELSKEFSILSQFTSFVAIEERDKDQPDSGITDVPKIIAEEDVDILPYMGWTEEEDMIVDNEEEWDYAFDEEEYEEVAFYEPVCSPAYAPTSPSASSIEDNAYAPRRKIQSKICKKAASIQLEQTTSQISDIRKSSLVQENPEFEVLCYREPVKATPSVTPAAAAVNMPFKFGEKLVCADALPQSRQAVPHLPPGAPPTQSFVPFLTAASPLPPPATTQPISNLFGSVATASSGLFGPTSRSASSFAPPPPPPVTQPIPELESYTSSDSGLRHDLPPSISFFAPPPPATTQHISNLFGCVATARSVLFGSTSRSAPLPPVNQPIPELESFTTSDFGLRNDLFPSFSLFAPPPPPPPPLATTQPISNVFGSVATAPSALFGSTSYSVSFAPPPPPPVTQPIPELESFPTSDSGLCHDHPPPVSSFASPPILPPILPKPSAVTPQFSLPPAVKCRKSSSLLKTPDAAITPTPPDQWKEAVHDIYSKLSERHRFAPMHSLPASSILAAEGSVDAPLLPERMSRLSRHQDADTSAGFGVFSGGRCGGRRRRRNLVDQSEAEFSYISHVQCGSKEYRPTRFSLRERLRSPDGINWEELFTLQHQDGYWECTRSLSRFLGLDIDFFANVFLKEKGICSLGVKAHADILKLVATLLVLQLMRVKKMVDVELFQSLFRLSESPEPRPACYDAVKKAVDWVCWADRQYPCVCSRLEFGLNWESCTRQLLGLDSLPPCSPLTPVLQRSTGISVM
uniref:Poly [ADP-ribose] polymerase n=1 Tax=Astyanax mexicanus TaxID=7994 RepID=A0A8B9LMC2_ASTMX